MNQSQTPPPKRVSIVIPVYNEVALLKTVLDAVESAPVLELEKEIIVVDDGSVDGSRELISNLPYPPYKAILHNVNTGKGGALHTGFSHSTGDIIIVQDADLEYDPNDYPILLTPFLNKSADVVYGSRFLGNLQTKRTFLPHTWIANRILTTISNILSRLKLTDAHTCYKVFRRDLLDDITLEEKRFSFCAEFTQKIARVQGLRITEVPVAYNARGFDEGKKIGFRDAFDAVRAHVKHRFSKLR